MAERESGGLALPQIVSRKTWLSGIPDRWDVELVKRLFRFNAKTRVSTTDQVLSLTRRGIIERDISGNEGQLAESYEKYPEVKEGDFVLNPMDLIAGWVAKSYLKGKVSSAYYTFHLSDSKRGFAPFLELVFQTYYREKIFDPFGSGLGRMESGGGRWTLGRDVLMNFPIPVPPLDEQKSAVKYLEQETTQIDLLISKKEQLIEKLLERRQSLITHVVTKGLDPNAPMKDSGVEWVGDVVSHWTLDKLGRILSFFNGRELERSETGKYPIYGSGGVFGWSDTAQNPLASPSILFGRKGTIDRPLMVSGPFSCVDTMYWTRLVSVAHVEYMYYLATILPYKQLSTQTAMPSMTSSDLKALKVPVPPIEEQELIASYLSVETSQIDTLVENTRKAIDLLKERRQALITQVVTGKIDVRGFAGGNS